MSKREYRLGILCGGGPAPGINSVISAATIEAIKSGWQVIGIRNGFQDLMSGNLEEAEPLTIEEVSRIHLQGGSILYTSRANPTRRAEDLERTVESIRKLGLDALLTIGGDATGHSAARVAAAAGGSLKVAHVPKTIDNDLPLPAGMPTFGFQTARHVGVDIVTNLMTDAMTTRRWHLVVTMGRQAGHLALGIGKAAGATVTVIAEDFHTGRPIALDHIVDILETTMLKRMVQGRPFGVAILSEGLSLRVRPEDLETAGTERDEHGHMRLAEVHLQRAVTDMVRERFLARGQKLTIVGKNIGYELRCAPPIPFDIEYTRDLGFGAIDYLRGLLESGSDEVGAMVTLQEGKLRPLRFGTFNDEATGRPRVRVVDVTTESYRVARQYQIRLEASDLEDGPDLDAISRAAGLGPEAFRERYGYIIREDTFPNGRSPQPGQD